MLKATFTNIKHLNVWGVRVEGIAQVGDIVMSHRRDGKTKEVQLTQVTWSGKDRDTDEPITIGTFANIVYVAAPVTAPIPEPIKAAPVRTTMEKVRNELGIPEPVKAAPVAAPAPKPVVAKVKPTVKTPPKSNVIAFKAPAKARKIVTEDTVIETTLERVVPPTGTKKIDWSKLRK